MAIGAHRVQVTKQESTALGGADADAGPYSSDQPLNPQEDALEAAGVYFQDAANRDELVFVARDGNDLIFRDVTTGAIKTLTELAAAGGGGISEASTKPWTGSPIGSTKPVLTR